VNRLELSMWRRTRWLSQPQLADLLGVATQTVYRWEAGQTEFPAFLELALAQLEQRHTFTPDGVDAVPRLDPVS
jgi:DNA-binding transcriptional regulator YiaG